MNNNIRRFTEPGARMYLLFLVIFALASVVFEQYTLASIQAGAIIFLLVYSLVIGSRRRKQLLEYIESVTYDVDTAKNNTLMNFPLPMAVIGLNDSRVVWANKMFFDMCGIQGSKMDTRVSDMVPGFSGKWLVEGKTQHPELVEIGGRKYQVHGNIIRQSAGDTKERETRMFMGISYWVDVTEYDNTRVEYEQSRPVVATIIIDNYDEITKNQPDRVKSDLREDIEDRIRNSFEGVNAIVRRYERDSYLVVFEARHLASMRETKFPILEDAHTVISAAGIHATLSIGMGVDGASFGENMQFSSLASEMALSRGGDQTVIKNRFNFEFFGGRGNEVETRTKVKSRVMANAFMELVKDSSRVFVMGHKFADLDAVGAAVGVCCIARNAQKPYKIVIERERTDSERLISRLEREAEYKNSFISPKEAMLIADGRSLLVVVDTNRPEQVENSDFLESCNRVVVIDHHRRAATYIQNADLTFHEPFASSVCELMSEMLQELVEPSDVLRCEAEAVLSGIVLDTKNFSIRTGERTFEAAAFLGRVGADTTEVKKLLQNDMDNTVARYSLLQTAQRYKDSIAIAAKNAKTDRVVVAQAADELLNISGVETSFVLVSADGGVSISARALGSINVQVIMEKLGGGGNKSAAAAYMSDTDLRDAVNKLFAAIDEYLEE